MVTWLRHPIYEHTHACCTDIHRGLWSPDYDTQFLSTHMHAAPTYTEVYGHLTMTPNTRAHTCTLHRHTLRSMVTWLWHPKYEHTHACCTDIHWGPQLASRLLKALGLSAHPLVLSCFAPPRICLCLCPCLCPCPCWPNRHEHGRLLQVARSTPLTVKVSCIRDRMMSVVSWMTEALIWQVIIRQVTSLLLVIRYVYKFIHLKVVFT